jgi:hypothetical protein
MVALFVRVPFYWPVCIFVAVDEIVAKFKKYFYKKMAARFHSSQLIVIVAGYSYKMGKFCKLSNTYRQTAQNTV